jgi:hypothetical protein
MRYRTAALICAVSIGMMFGLPAVVEAVFLPSLKLGIPNPVPLYEQILLGTALLCLRWRLALLLPTVAVLFTVAIFTRQLRSHK